MDFSKIITAEWWLGIFNALIDFVRKYIIAIIIIGALGVAAYLYYIKEDEKAAWSAAYTGIGAALFKAFQFSGIFKEEAKKALQDILQSREYKDALTVAVAAGMYSDQLAKFDSEELYKIWSQASLHMYKRKFEAISKDLHDIISENYLPVKSRYYMSNVDCEIRIREFKDGYLQTEEIIHGDYHADSPAEFMLPAQASYDTDDLLKNVGSMTVQVLVFSGSHNFHPQVPLWDHTSVDEEMNLDENLNRVIWHKEFKVAGFQDYYVVRKVAKRYPLKRNETKHFIFGTLTHSVTAVLCMESAVKDLLYADCVQLGTVEAFIADPLEASVRSNGHMCVRYKGLILPSQGFMFHFKERNKRAV